MPFSIIDEGTLPEVFSLAEFLEGEGGPASIYMLQRRYDQPITAWFQTNGHLRYQTEDGDLFALSRGGSSGRREYIVRIAEGYVYPAHGVICSAEGWIGQRTAAEARYMGDDLQHVLKGATPDNIALRTQRSIQDVAVIAPWGALHNFGHFLFDAVPAIAVLLPLIQARRLRLLLPPLQPWQDEILSILGLGDANRVDVCEESVHVRNVYYLSYMDHYLIWPGFGTRLASDLLRAYCGAAPTASDARLYLARRGQHKRAVANSEEVESIFAECGFRILQPETLSVGEQLRAVSESALVAGAVGANWGSYLAAAPNSTAIEIMPFTYPSTWIRNFSACRGARWRCLVTSPESTIRRSGEETRGHYLPNADFNIDPTLLRAELRTALQVAG